MTDEFKDAQLEELMMLARLERKGSEPFRYDPTTMHPQANGLDDGRAGVLATFYIHTARGVSRRPSVVVMQAIENRDCHDTTVSLGHSRHGLFLPEALVWPSLVVEAGVLRDEAQKMVLAKHEDMLEQFAPKSADKALGVGVHVRGPDRGANDFGGRKPARVLPRRAGKNQHPPRFAKSTSCCPLEPGTGEGRERGRH